MKKIPTVKRKTYFLYPEDIGKVKRNARIRKISESAFIRLLINQ